MHIAVEKFLGKEIAVSLNHNIHEKFLYTIIGPICIAATTGWVQISVLYIHTYIHTYTGSTTYQSILATGWGLEWLKYLLEHLGSAKRDTVACAFLIPPFHLCMVVSVRVWWPPLRLLLYRTQGERSYDFS